MRFSIFIIIIILFSTGLWSEDLDSEIRNYKESDKVYISKARQFIADELEKGNISKVKELTGHLDAKFEGSLNLPFIPWEKYILGLAADSLEMSFATVDFIVKVSSWNKYIFPEKDALYLLLDDILINDHGKFTEYLSEAGLSDEKSKVMIIFLDLFSRDLVKGIDQNSLNDKCDIFLEKYPNSAYKDFIRHKIRNVWITGNWGYGFDFDGGLNTMTSDLGNYFKDGPVFDFSLYATYKSTVLRLNLNAASMYAKKDFSQNGDWEKGDHFNFTSYGLELGYELFESRKFKFEPHLFGGASQLDFSESEYKSKEILIPSWSYGVGFSLYFKVSRSIHMDYRQKNGFWYISLNCDYLIPTFASRNDDFEGNSLSLTLGLGGYIRPMVRDL